MISGLLGACSSRGVWDERVFSVEGVWMYFYVGTPTTMRR